MKSKTESVDSNKLEKLDYRDAYAWVMSALATLFWSLIGAFSYSMPEKNYNWLWFFCVQVVLCFVTWYLYKKFRRDLAAHKDMLAATDKEK